MDEFCNAVADGCVASGVDWVGRGGGLDGCGVLVGLGEGGF